MKNKGLLIGLGVVILIIGVFVANYNSLVSLSESVKNGYADIDVQLERRSDLIPNLVETVKGYAAHEEEIFTAVSDARSDLINAGSVEDAATANSELDSALGRLLAISEAYPELKANENFIRLQDELAGTENRISTARRDYNNLVGDYNTKVKSFPTNILAGMFGFDEEEYFEASEGSEEVPGVDFE